MVRKRRGGPARILRRGIGLALVLIGVWALSLTADLSGAAASLRSLGQQPEFWISAMAHELGVPPQDSDLPSEMDGWGQLLIRQSALLYDGKGAVAALLSAQDTPAPEDAAPTPIDRGDHAQEDSTLDPVQHGDVVEHTAVGKDDGSYLSVDRVYLKNSTKNQEVDVAAAAASPVEITLGDGPQILIMHSHSTEAYTQDEADPYVESDPYRTTDCTKNVVRVGEEMAEVFRSQGFEVMHDTGLYDYPAYNGAYERSRAAVEKWLEQYPTIQIVLDVHRDALVSADGAAYKLVTDLNGSKVAQVMLVVGSNDSGMEHPNWRANLALAVKLQLALTADFDRLARPITLRSSRYNQHLSPGSLLVEVGGHGNTLQEAISGARLFAQSAGKVFQMLLETPGT